MEIFSSRAQIKDWSQLLKGQSVAFVPTMGFLHEGHLSLVRLAQQHAEKTVVSIYVNPTQFGAHEDLDKYPRDIDGDLEKLQRVGVDAVFLPSDETLYPEGFDTFIEPAALQNHLCGPRRPGHFRGVCTVVYLLFKLIGPKVAVFGAKDYQQLQILKGMNQDLSLGITMISGPIVREKDGLAMSSRNRYLSDDERRSALALNQALNIAEKKVAAGHLDGASIQRSCQEHLTAAGLQIDYVDLVSPNSLQPLDSLESTALLALAAFAGNTRLIDNRLLHRGSLSSSV